MRREDTVFRLSGWCEDLALGYPLGFQNANESL